MRVTVRKWGNGAAVPIPAAILEAVHLGLNKVADVYEESGRIIIEAVRSNEYDLSQLLANITTENLHAEVDFGPALGKETF